MSGNKAGFRKYRAAVAWLTRECGDLATHDLAKDKSVRLVAALSDLNPMEVAGEVWRAHQRRARVLAAVRLAARESGGFPHVKAVSMCADACWGQTRHCLEELSQDGEIILHRRGLGPITVEIVEDEA